MQERVPLMWLGGPDRLVVDAGNTVRNVVDECFVNINAEDFGIDIDRIARLGIDEDSVLVDGELWREPSNAEQFVENVLNLPV